MKYWTFDVVQLIADYDKNRKTLAAIQETRRLADKYIKSPIGATTRGDWEQYIRVLDLRETEYQLYVDMVYMGLNDLPEVERLVIKYWLIDRFDDSEVLTRCGIESMGELKKIKKIALTKFTNIVMPN